MSVNAKMIGEYSVSPIMFGDENGGFDVLQRVGSIDEIAQAYIFDVEGNVFADYQKQDVEAIVPEFKNVSYAEFKGDYLHVYQPIVFLNTNYGTIYLKVSTQHLSDKLFSQVKWMLLFGIVILLISWLLAIRLQRLISRPIDKLTTHADQISTEGDFSLRVAKNSSDEIGMLYDRFNHMVGQVEKHQKRQKISQIELTKSEEKYRNIFQNSMIGIYRQLVDHQEVLDMNDAAALILGVNRNERNKISNKLFTNPKDYKNFLKKLKEMGKVDNFETQITRKDGAHIWVSISGRIIDEGVYEGIIQDITINKMHYLDLQKANFELDNFVYHASHDLRSPLLSVLGLVNIASQEDSIDEMHMLFQMIGKSVRKLDGLVNDLLLLSRDNRVNDPYVVIDIEELTQESISNYDFIEGFNEIKINVHVNIAENARLLTDKTRVNVLLNNLISNAIKYRKKIGVEPYIDIDISLTNTSCSIKISDNGEGIKKEFQEQIFEMFYRATESSEGSGLGLYIVKNVIEKLGAKIEFESTFDEGTTFTAVIPNHISDNELDPSIVL
jgi:PAS domain S-box-containing protein